MLNFGKKYMSAYKHCFWLFENFVIFLRFLALLDYVSRYLTNFCVSPLYPMGKPKTSIIWKTSDRRAKRVEIWASGASIQCTQGTFDTNLLIRFPVWINVLYIKGKRRNERQTIFFLYCVSVYDKNTHVQNDVHLERLLSTWQCQYIKQKRCGTYVTKHMWGEQVSRASRVYDLSYVRKLNASHCGISEMNNILLSLVYNSPIAVDQCRYSSIKYPWVNTGVPERRSPIKNKKPRGLALCLTTWKTMTT